jgi:hypothetical protein
MPRALAAALTACLIAVYLLTPPLAAALGIARLQAGPTAIEWLPEIFTDSWVLSVAGPDGTAETRQFSGGASPTWSLFDKLEGER